MFKTGKADDVQEGIQLFLNTLDELGITTYEHFHEYGWKEGLNPYLKGVTAYCYNSLIFQKSRQGDLNP